MTKIMLDAGHYGNYNRSPAFAIGIASGLASTGADQAVKQLYRGGKEK